MKLPILFLFLATSACQPSLERQPRIEVLEEPKVPVAGTFAYAPNEKIRPKITRAIVLRGQARYEIYCSVCHGITGDGDGLATERGFGAPLSFRELNLQTKTLVELETLIAGGQGRMLGFSDRIPFADRFAIAAYTQVLSLREHFPVSALTPAEKLIFKVRSNE